MDADGRLILPGFHDTHTHLTHAADLSNAEEYERLLREEIFTGIRDKRGGGLSGYPTLSRGTCG
jgi:imidazolonepropionase-like amidohydrolase